jgi:PAS domain S-box-containing protein
VKRAPVEPSTATAALSVIWIGDATLVERYVTRRAPHIRISACGGPDMPGLVQQAASGEPPPDVLVLDTTLPGVDPLQVLDLVKSHGLDLPVVLITPPSGKDELILQISRLAICDCVVKTEDYVYQMLPAFAQVRARHDLHAVFRASRESQEHLLHILEMQPAIVFILDAETRVTAMNRAGLALFTAGGEKVVGQKFTAFLPVEEQPAVAGLIERACLGESGELDHSLGGANGDLRRVRTRVVTLPRSSGNVALATLVPVPKASQGDDRSSEIDRLMLAFTEARAEADAIRAEAQAAESRWTAARQADEEAHLFALEERDLERARLHAALDSRVRELQAELSERERRLQEDAAKRERMLQEALANREHELREELAARERSLQDALANREHELKAELAEQERTVQEAQANRERELRDELAERERSLMNELVERERTLNEELAARERTLAEDLAGREQALREELTAKEHALADASREFKSRLAETTSTNLDLEIARDRLAAELSQTLTHAAALEADCGRLSDELAAVRGQIETIADRSDHNHEVLAERERELRKEFARRERSLQDELAERERALLDDFAQRERALNDQVAARDGQLSAKDEQISARDEQLSAKEQMLQAAIREAKARQAQAVSTIRDLDAERDRLATELSEARRRASALASDCDRLSNELGAAHSRAETLLGHSESDRAALAERERVLQEEICARDRAAQEAMVERERALQEQMLEREAEVRAEMVERERAVRAEMAERERALKDEIDERERALIDDQAAKERALADVLAAREQALAEALARCESFIGERARLIGELDTLRSRAEALANTAEEERRDLFEVRELLMGVLFEADQRYRSREQRSAAPSETDDTKRQSFLAFKNRLSPTSGSRDR